MKIIFYVLLIVSTGCLIIFNYSGCSSSLPNVELDQTYNFPAKQKITTYIVPSGNSQRDEAYSRVLFLDLRARGYEVTDANRLLYENSEKVSGQNHRQIADSLITKKYISASNVYIIAQPTWDSAFVLTYYSESEHLYWIYYKFAGMYASTLKSQVTFFDWKIREPIKSFTAIDTAYIYSEKNNSDLLYPEYSWMVAAKQISRKFADIPICSIVNTPPAENKFAIDLWVDESYRNAFPNTWKDRLRLRILYANDIFQPQFSVELFISNFVEWNSKFDRSLDNTLVKLNTSTKPNPNTLKIAITLNNELKQNWRDRKELGKAFLLGNEAAITAQPSFPAVGQDWNPIEEAITIAHEIGHIFGAIHIPDENSIMYPSAGSLSYEFDPVNKKIIEATKKNFLRKDGRERLITYSEELVKIKDFPSPNSNPILSAIANVVALINYKSQIITKNSERTFTNLSNLLPDSVITLAVMGYLELKENKYEEAKNSFIEVLEINPDFAEVHYYLSQTLQNMGDIEEADRYKNFTKPYSKLWIIDKY